ncbi:citrate lyase holo-[acyl-carrier protein] synthase [Orbaceae bacterium ESL0727]|nr:citrate lyase holo-[acyl-carrier protein] synthase [Orbaceae bacterium ESL0727]
MTYKQIDFNEGKPVTLAQMLSAKEQRVLHQQQAINHYSSALISLTLVIPGPVKQSPVTHYLFEQAIAAIKTTLADHHIPILDQQYYDEVTGEEAIIVVDYAAISLKEICIQLEIDHPLGRLWDIDVIDPLTHMSVSRSQFDFPRRTCFVCDDEAKVCGRMRKHSLDDLFSAMAALINAYMALDLESTVNKQTIYHN